MNLRRASKWLIAAFCTWHIFAIGVYSFATILEKSMMNILHDGATNVGFCDEGGGDPSLIEKPLIALGICSTPFEDEYEPKLPINKQLKAIVKPYVLITSQWQRWNLFAPDPLRRVITYHFEVEEQGDWKEFTTIGPDSTHPLRSAYMLKLARRLDSDSKKEAQDTVLRAHLYGRTCGTRIARAYAQKLLRYTQR